MCVPCFIFVYLILMYSPKPCIKIPAFYPLVVGTFSGRCNFGVPRPPSASFLGCCLYCKSQANEPCARHYMHLDWLKLLELDQIRCSKRSIIKRPASGAHPRPPARSSKPPPEHQLASHTVIKCQKAPAVPWPLISSYIVKALHAMFSSP